MSPHLICRHPVRSSYGHLVKASRIALSFVDTLGLAFLLLLKLDGRQYPVSDVLAFRAVEHFDVVEPGVLHRVNGKPRDVFVLALED